MSKKHSLNKGKLEKFGKREEDIVQVLQKYDQEHHPKGETLSTPTRVFRIKVVQAFLKSGTPLNRLEFFRDIFEEAGMSLSSSCNINQLISFTSEEEYTSLEKESKGKDVGIIFDGTTREGEALVVLVRFVHEWEVKSRLVRFQITQSSVNGDELVRIIIKVLQRKLDVPQSQLLAAMRDRAPVNTKTIGKVSILYPGMLDVGCISYFLDRVAVKSVTPVFDTIHVSMKCDLHYQYESKMRLEEPNYKSRAGLQLHSMVESVGMHQGSVRGVGTHPCVLGV